MMDVCGICQEEKPKYTCPACGLKTCLLTCVKRHKKQMECSGQVDQTRFIPKKSLAELSTHINRDYNFLLRFGRDIQLGKQDVLSHAFSVFKRGNGPNRPAKRFKSNNDERIKAIARAFPHDPPVSVKRENTLVVLLPSGMSRASSNKLGYDKKLAKYTWTVEWVLVDKSGTEQEQFLSFRLKEHLALKDIVPMNVVNESLKVLGLEKSLLCFYLDNVVNPHKPRRSLIRLDPAKPLLENLANKIVVEYPKIYITLDGETWAEFAETEEEAYGLHQSTSESESDSDSDSDSDSSDSDDAPEETSSKGPKSGKMEAAPTDEIDLDMDAPIEAPTAASSEEMTEVVL